MQYVAHDGDNNEFYLQRVSSKSATPIMVSVDIEGKSLDMEVDTDAPFSIISENTHKADISNLKLRQSSIHLKTYTNEQIDVVRQLNVHVKYGD